MQNPKLRIARPTTRLKGIVSMYVQGLGMQELGGFQDHEGYDGVMVGHANQAYHLEFTHEFGSSEKPAPSAEHLLVFYEPDMELWQTGCAKMLKAGFVRVPAQNPYWEREAQTFRDLDGYLVVLCRQEWGR